MTGERPVRLVGVSFLNSRPLVAGLEAAIPAPFAYTYRPAMPAEAADALGRGEAVAGLIPAASLTELPGFTALPDLGVACRGAVRSVLVLSRVEPGRIARLAVHSASRTSAALARLLLAERWGATPEVIAADPPLERMLLDTDAALVIGDPALAVSGQTGLHELDLGAEWLAWTGLPFVFAVWALRDDAPAGLADLLRASHAHGKAHFADLALHWAAAHEVAPDLVRDYLGRTLHFTLGDAEREGMRTFLARAIAAGLLPRTVPPAPHDVRGERQR